MPFRFEKTCLEFMTISRVRFRPILSSLKYTPALFCLEYRVKPTDIETELRIYQSDDILCHNPTADDISAIMNKIIVSDKIIKKIKERES